MTDHASYSAYPQRIAVSHASYLAYAPRGAGLLCALFCFPLEKDVYGWWIGARDHDFSPAFFALRDFYSAHQTCFYASLGNDLYGGWALEYTVSERALDDPLPVPGDLCHSLLQTQDEFAREWLFFADDPDAAGEASEYEKAGLPLRPVNIRFRRLSRFDRGPAVWVHASHNLDMQVVDWLRLRWPLDYRDEPQRL